MAIHWTRGQRSAEDQEREHGDDRDLHVGKDHPGDGRRELFKDDEAHVILHEVDERGDGESEVASFRECLANLAQEVRGPRRVALVATLDDARERRDGEDELEELSLRRRARGGVSLVSRAGREGGRAKGLLVGFA